jgi:hypothetical protein
MFGNPPHILFAWRFVFLGFPAFEVSHSDYLRGTILLSIETSKIKKHRLRLLITQPANATVKSIWQWYGVRPDMADLLMMR